MLTSLAAGSASIALVCEDKMLNVGLRVPTDDAMCLLSRGWHDPDHACGHPSSNGRDLENIKHYSYAAWKST